MKHTLWSLLKERKIEIPIFQRDYAQGREDKATLRRDILHQLQLSLNGGKSEDGHMDFVYSFGDVTSRPLDGQQRLTTLWLLHWYLAINVLEGKELESALSRLQRFSYRTRRSSSNFIDSLCDMTNVCNLRDNPDIATAIRNCTWFDKAWEKDPTVKGMLLSLSGQPPVNNSGPNGIQPIFEENRNRFNSMWQLLISEKCPIHFDFLTIEDVEVKSPDILYVKMNARGKSLSHFEKFKAQWISLMREIDADKSFHISKSIDTEWNERFWRTDLKTVGLDQRKMAFYSRYFFCCLLNNLCTHQRFKDLNLSEKGKFISDSVLYKNERGSDLCFPFNSIDDFSIILQAENDKDQKNPFSLLTTDAVDNLNDLFRSIERLGNNTITDCLPSYMSDFDFLSGLQKDNNSNKYKEDKDGNYWVKQLTLTQMVVFYALSTYLQISKNRNEQSLKRWMRVCCNIAENTNRNSELPVFINVISKIQELATFSVGDVLGCDDIYNTLLMTVTADEIPNNEFEAVLWEEKEKAKEILVGSSVSEEEIIEAENSAFFKGAIRFLFMDERGNVDWSNFNGKYAVCKDLFDSKGLTEYAEKNYVATRILISYCRYWMKQIQQKTYHLFSKKDSDWKKILLSYDYQEPVHNLLINNTINKNPSLKDNDTWREKSHSFLIGSSYIDYLVCNKRDSYYISWREEEMCLYLPYYPDNSYYITPDRIRIMEYIEANLPEFVKIEWPKDKLFSRNHNFDIYYKNLKFRFQYWGWIDMYDFDGTRLIDNPALKGKCTMEIKSIDPQYNELNQIISNFDACIDSYNEWLNSTSKSQE